MTGRRKASKNFHGDAFKPVSIEEVKSWLKDQQEKDSIVKVEISVIIDNKKRKQTTKSKSNKEAS
jgi:hypothetical protein